MAASSDFSLYLHGGPCGERSIASPNCTQGPCASVPKLVLTLSFHPERHPCQPWALVSRGTRWKLSEGRGLLLSAVIWPSCLIAASQSLPSPLPPNLAHKALVKAVPFTCFCKPQLLLGLGLPTPFWQRQCRFAFVRGSDCAGQNSTPAGMIHVEREPWRVAKFAAGSSVSRKNMLGQS